MQKTILTAIFTLFLGLFLTATATAALMQYSGGGFIHSYFVDDQGENPYGLHKNNQVSWSVTYDADWVDGFGYLDLGERTDQGASLTLNIGDWIFTHDQGTTLFPGAPSVHIFDGKPLGFDFMTDLGDAFATWSQFHVIGNSFSFMSFWNEPAHGFFDFSKITINPGASTVPIPGAVWLLGSGLLGLVGLRRKIAW